MDALHLKNQQLAAEIGARRDTRAKDQLEIQSEISRLTGELKETAADLETRRRKLASLRNQKDVVVGPPTLGLGPGKKSDHCEKWGPEKVSKESKELELVLEEAKQDRDAAVLREKEAFHKSELAEGSRRVNAVVDLKIGESEGQLQQCMAERDNLQLRSEEKVHSQGRKDSVDSDKVEKVFNHEAQTLQCRLREQLSQLKIESGLFLRLMYKNKNQHRRSLYYQRLSEVRRNLQLLSTAGLDETVECFLKFFSAKRPGGVSSKDVTQSKFRDAMDEGKSMRTLLSVARLLNQSDGPIMASSAQLAGLLGQSFFMPFALTMFSCLARFRMLLIQILYEVVTLYNLLSAKRKSVSTSSMGRNLPVELECQWDGVKLSMTENRLANFPESGGALSDVPAELPQLWFVDDRTGVKHDLKVPAASAGPSRGQLCINSGVAEDRTGAGDYGGNCPTLLSRKADMEQVTGQSLGNIVNASTSNNLQNANCGKRMPVAYISIRSGLKGSQNKRENDSKLQPQPVEITSSAKRQQLLTGLNPKKSKLKTSNVDSKDRSNDSLGDSESKTKTNDIFAMLLG